MEFSGDAYASWVSGLAKIDSVQGRLEPREIHNSSELSNILDHFLGQA